MNQLHDELEGIDYAWVAVDSLGQIAVFTTGGEGPVPETARAGIEEAEELVEALSEASKSQVPTGLEALACFTFFARRGLFAYDWSDVHRTTAESINAYELMAFPTVPLRVESLPESLRLLAQMTRLEHVTFGSQNVVLGVVAA